MTTDELRDWHARRAGWTYKVWNTGEGWRRNCLCRPDCCDYVYHPSHPFPATLDGADASFPNGWDWGRTPPRGDWCAVSLDRGMTEQTAYTGDKIHDLYELSKLAWEQEAAR